MVGWLDGGDGCGLDGKGGIAAETCMYFLGIRSQMGCPQRGSLVVASLDGWENDPRLTPPNFAHSVFPRVLPWTFFAFHLSQSRYKVNSDICFEIASEMQVTLLWSFRACERSISQSIYCCLKFGKYSSGFMPLTSQVYSEN